MIGDILGKLARGGSLTPEEINQLEFWGNKKAEPATNAVMGWLQRGSKSGMPGFDYFNAVNSEFVNPPLEYGVWKATQTIPAGSYGSALISWDTEIFNNSFKWDSSAPTKIYLPQTTNGLYLIYGVAAWDDLGNAATMQRALVLLPSAGSSYQLFFGADYWTPSIRQATDSFAAPYYFEDADDVYFEINALNNDADDTINVVIRLGIVRIK